MVVLLNRFRIPTLLALCALAACTPPRAAEPAADSPDAGCAARVLVMFSEGFPGSPDVSLVTDVSRSAGVELQFERAVGAGIYLFSLAAADADCRDALGRLRADSRIRSAELDATRKPLRVKP